MKYVKFDYSSTCNYLTVIYFYCRVWSHWHIKNNTFNSMVFNHGDRCGDIERSVEASINYIFSSFSAEN